MSESETCKLDFCDRPVKVIRFGLCSGHYKQQREGREFKPLRKRAPVNKGVCSVEGCNRPHYTRGYCSGHDQRVRKGIPVDGPLQTRISPYKRKREDGKYLCTRCDRYLEEVAFHKGSGASGKATWCKRCQSVWKYGLTAPEYEAMYEGQLGKCLICQEQQEVLAVDHDHSCCPTPAKSCGSCVRGLLCKNCNSALGYLRDSPEAARAAAEYLESFSGNRISV